MSVSSHRKLNVEQLINLAQVYWDDPTKLMEIGDASGGRVDAAAQLLAAAVAGRLERLRADPARALGEGPPDLAALIAARLGTSKAPEESAPTEQVAAEAAPGGWRRWPALAALVLLLGAVGAWWFWPRAVEVPVAAADRDIGINVRQGGLPAVEEEDKEGVLTGLPPGRRRPQFVDLDDELPEIEAAAAETESRGAPAPRVRDPARRKVREADADGAARSPRVFEPSPKGAEDGEARASGGGSAAAGAAAAGGAAGGAKARSSPGVVIEEALLQCYLTDSRPTACVPAAGGGAATGSSAAARPTSPGTGDAAARSSSQAAAAAGRSAASARGSSSSASGERGDSAGVSRSGSGGGSGSGGSQGGAASAGDRSSASASAGGGGRASKSPPAKALEKSPKAAADPECPEAPEQGRVVFVFDGSISMGLPLGVPPAEEDRLDQGVLRRDPEARRQYRALLQQPGPKRMARAQDAFADATAELPETVELGLVVFQECRDIRKVGVFDGASRGTAIDYVDSLVPRGRTPLAQSLASAAELLGDGPSSIVMLTDGIEFCRGDPCAVAAEIKAAHPRTPVHIVDVTGQARTACVAEITGGRSYAPAEADDLAAVLRAAFRGAAPRCAAASP